MLTSIRKSGRQQSVRAVSPSRQSRLVRPKSANELARVLAAPAHYPSPVRAIGSASSSTRCTEAPGGTLVDLCDMNRVLRVDRDSVTVQPGITLAELADVLDAEGLEPPGGFDYANRTVGGAMSAAGLEAFGHGLNGSLASSVRQIKFITADGQKGCVNAGTSTMLKLFVLSYGLLGIAYEVTLAVRPMENFSVDTVKVEMADIANLLAQLEATGASARLRLLPFRGTVHCQVRESAAGESKGAPLAWRLRSWAMNSAMPSAAFALAKMLPVDRLRYSIVDSLGEKTLNLSSPTALNGGAAGSDQLTQTNLFAAVNVDRTSWAFPRSGFALVAKKYVEFSRQHYRRTGFRCDLPAAAYPAARDSSALLSPSFEQPIVTLMASSNSADGWDDFAFEFAEFALTHGGIPLMGHSLHMTAKSIKDGYGRRWDAFCRTREQLDPENRLVNSFFENFIAS